jgi:hypothetical protein
MKSSFDCHSVSIHHRSKQVPFNTFLTSQFRGKKRLENPVHLFGGGNRLIENGKECREPLSASFPADDRARWSLYRPPSRTAQATHSSCLINLHFKSLQQRIVQQIGMLRINNLRCKFSLFSSSCNTILIARSFAALLLNFSHRSASEEFHFLHQNRIDFAGDFLSSIRVVDERKMRAERINASNQRLVLRSSPN